MELTKEQQCFVKEELLAIIWGDLESNWKSICELISESTAEEFAGLEEQEVYQLLRENLDCKVMKAPNSYHLPLVATYKDN